jgi:hypothetical protein
MPEQQSRTVEGLVPINHRYSANTPDTHTRWLPAASVQRRLEVHVRGYEHMQPTFHLLRSYCQYDRYPQTMLGTKRTNDTGPAVHRQRLRFSASNNHSSIDAMQKHPLGFHASFSAAGA